MNNITVLVIATTYQRLKIIIAQRYILRAPIETLSTRGGREGDTAESESCKHEVEQHFVRDFTEYDGE